MKKLLLLLFLLPFYQYHANSQDTISWNQFKDYIGKKVSVSGQIISTNYTGKVCFLKFSKNNDELKIVIFDSDYKKFNQKPDQYYYQKQIIVTGEIVDDNGKPTIYVSEQNQINLLEGITGDSDCLKRVSWDKTKDYTGECVTVYGNAIIVKKTPKAWFINFNSDYKTTFSIVIFKDSFINFPFNFQEMYKNKNIEVTGVIQTYNGKPEIIIEHPNQIRIIE